MRIFLIYGGEREYEFAHKKKNGNLFLEFMVILITLGIGNQYINNLSSKSNVPAQL